MNNDLYSLDLYKALTTNPEFNSKVTKQLKLVQLADAKGDREAVANEIHELLKLCEFNASLLVPYFFPKYPETEPMTLWSRPHAFSMFAMTLLGQTVVKASRQVGKCVGGATKVVTKELGEISMQDLFEHVKNTLKCS